MDLEASVKTVQQRIEAACARAGREPGSVTLVAVTKGQPPEVVCAAAALGLSLFGENKVQEAKAKIPQCPDRLRWHMVGHLQTNKCRDAVGLFEMVQSVDSLHLAEDRIAVDQEGNGAANNGCFDQIKYSHTTLF